MPARRPAAASVPRQSATSASNATIARGAPRVARSAASTCRSQSSTENAGGNPFRAASERATAPGWRTGSSTACARPPSSSAAAAAGSSSARRGSFQTNSGAVPNSRSSSAPNRAGPISGATATCRHSAQALPPSASSASLAATSGADSKNPSGLSGPGGSAVAGAVAPHSTVARASSEVPLLCMPGISTQSGRPGASPSATAAPADRSRGRRPPRGPRGPRLRHGRTSARDRAG